ncbi:hypothetical protein GGR26_002622 [Lewinella marina]|uniref:Lipocalin-like domain-containing protein n=1 Tax=Neolewinella marina TaxID=438751 RepID=A0A2G0CDA3_9BACT|nr:hypothetical protein [Neolewinella marina]NJB86845.1 hypothetical protein [Neolewinella marina]PHK97954.1 hypothetical protein CGL56_14170 [Neolewinella marina]
MIAFCRIGYVLLFCSIFSIGCAPGGDPAASDPSVELNNKLQGDWNVTSFTHDGYEQMDYSISTLEMDFKKDGPTSGELKQSYVFVDGSTETETSRYEVKNEGQEVHINGKQFTADLDGDEITLEGTVNDAQMVIKADRN